MSKPSIISLTFVLALAVVVCATTQWSDRAWSQSAIGEDDIERERIDSELNQAWNKHLAR